MEKSEQEILKEISEIIFPLTEKPGIACGFHPQEKAMVLCSKCSAGICRICLGKSEDLSHLICQECLNREQANRSFLHYLKVLKFPVLWVMLCIVLAGFAYAMGVGNPDLAAMEKNDKNYAWYQKDAGKILFAQASREKQRAAALRFLHRDRQAAAWSLKAAEAFAQCATFWADTPALPDIQAAQALMLADAGNTDEAIAMIEAIPTKNAESIYPALQFHLGELFLKKDDGKQADVHFRKAWDSRPGFDSNIDNLLGGVANSMKELEMMTKVRLICNTKWTGEMADYIEQRLNIETEIKMILPNKIDLKGLETKTKPQKLEKPKKVDFEIEMIE